MPANHFIFGESTRAVDRGWRLRSNFETGELDNPLRELGSSEGVVDGQVS
jgi:hypothetical protein